MTTDLWYPRTAAPWPLVVFGHGFASTPYRYHRLLRAWAGAGYLVAAPVFPLGNANAPGGPTEADLVNQPADMRFVITRLLASDSPLRGSIDAGRIAIAGQSDGAITAFAAAYERRWADARVDAAIVMSGAELGGIRQPLVSHAPPLLVVQGTGDRTNDPVNSYVLFRLAVQPKFLLVLHGSGHLAPYTVPSRALAVVERATIAFLGHYLRDEPLAELRRAADVPGFATLEGG